MAIDLARNLERGHRGEIGSDRMGVNLALSFRAILLKSYPVADASGTLLLFVFALPFYLK